MAGKMRHRLRHRVAESVAMKVTSEKNCLRQLIMIYLDTTAQDDGQGPEKMGKSRFLSGRESRIPEPRTAQMNQPPTSEKHPCNTDDQLLPASEDRRKI